MKFTVCTVERTLMNVMSADLIKTRYHIVIVFTLEPSEFFPLVVSC